MPKAKAQAPDPNQGVRAEWMKGAWGALWLPSNIQNGAIEGLQIDEFITQIKDLRTIDYVQLPLTCPSIFSPTHAGPHDIIESLWEGDTDASGNIINLVVPRATEDDPLLRWLKALRAAGLRTEIYVNSYNLLARTIGTTQTDYPDISVRWKNWCDTNSDAQTFINSQSYHVNGDNRRAYMFCYAEFILKEYAVRYGDLIDAWCFDSADNIMEDECGDDPASENLEHQRIYEAFANAVHTGNSNAAVAFNNSVGDRVENPFTTATYFDDYTFGHPFGGAGDMVENETLYTYNFHVIEWLRDYAGTAFLDDNRDWNDNVVSHFFPKQSTTSWAAGNTPCLTNDEFVEWTTTGVIDGGAITWGTPLIIRNLKNKSPNLTLQEYALTQLTLTDNYLKEFQTPGAPNWARQYTILPPAYVGVPYSHTLVEEIDLWDPEGDEITSILAAGNFPAWLTFTEKTPGVWTLSGIPTETNDTDYEFILQASDASGARNRNVDLVVYKNYDIEPAIIIATANTNYGINNTAVMYSEIQTAPDRLATFKISMDVVPTIGQAIISGISGGTSTENSWGIGTGTSSTQDVLFRGSDSEWVENINNIQIIDFNANGGGYTIEDITASFSEITIVNAQSTNDAVSFKKNGETINYGKSTNITQILDLETVLNTNSIKDFSIGIGNTEATNKWSVEGVSISIAYSTDTMSVDELTQNQSSLKLFPNPTVNSINFNIEPELVQIYDVNGKLLMTDNTGSFNLNISELNIGVYIVKFFNKQGSVFMKRIIKI
jgi:hypothetical protein